MLDDDWDDRTRRVFRDTPIFIPSWWGHYDPSYRGGISPKSVSVPAGRPAPSGGTSMPTLPGSAFAASVVTGVQTFSTRVVGNITEFTSCVASKTNPIPKSSSSGSSWKSGGGKSSSGHSCACACACACAGCACACAGGGR